MSGPRRENHRCGVILAVCGHCAIRRLGAAEQSGHGWRQINLPIALPKSTRLPSHGFCATLDEAKAKFAETCREWLALTQQ